VVRDAGYLTAIIGLGLLPTLVFDPVGTGCGECSTNLLLMHAGSGLQTTFGRLAIVAALVWATVCVIVLVHRLVRATPAGRLVLWPVIFPSAVLIGFFAIELALSARRAYLSTGGLDVRLWLGGQAALLCLTLGYAARWLRTRRARTVLARDVVELATPTTLDTVAARLAAALGDPTLEERRQSSVTARGSSTIRPSSPRSPARPGSPSGTSGCAPTHKRGSRSSKHRGSESSRLPTTNGSAWSETFMTAPSNASSLSPSAYGLRQPEPTPTLPCSTRHRPSSRKPSPNCE
jgi:hypothetical protein